MKHIKHIHENNNNDLTLNEFKYILSKLEDIESLTSLKFSDYTKSSDFASYECSFRIDSKRPKLQIDESIFDFFHYTEGDSVGGMFEYSEPNIENAIAAVDDIQEKIKTMIQTELPNIMKVNEDIKEILRMFETFKQRFEQYDNCKKVALGYSGHNIIEFELTVVLK